MKRSLVFCIAITALLAAAPTTALADNDGNTVEIGVEWVGEYVGTGSPAAQYGNINTSNEAVQGLYPIVTDPSTSWGWQFNYGNTAAWELDWLGVQYGGSSPWFTDDVDLAAFSGHGLGNRMDFNNQSNEWFCPANRLDAGYRDCEWILTFTCNYLRGTPANYGGAMNGVHLICGYMTDMTITADSGSWFAYYAKHPYGVRVAWYKYGQATQYSVWANTARTFGATASRNDYLWGYGSVSADPPYYSRSPDSYSWWDTNLNF